MYKNKNAIIGLALAWLFTAGSMLSVHAQTPARPLSLSPPTGLPVIPIMEGWYDNDDGSVTISFGYLNRNSDEVVDIPVGSNNYLEPAQFTGMQPTHFETGRHVGVFTVTLPREMRDESVWWHVRTNTHETLKVPGRASSTAYELDRKPRPQGSVQPVVWLEEGGPTGIGPDGVSGTLQNPVKINTPVELAVHTRDPSERDPEDPRFKEPLTLNLTWYLHQGPGKVEFSRHEAHPLPEPDPEAQSPRARRAPSGPEIVTLPRPEGTARIYASFSEPGEYLLRTRVDNFSAPESSAGDQCCWTNAYQKITVVP